MPWQAVSEIVFPVFILTAVGYTFGAFRGADVGLLTDIVLYLAAPCLIFTSLATGELDAATMATMALGATWLILSVGLALRVFASIMGIRLGALYLPGMFMNAGNMLLPLTLFAFGETGLRYGISVFVTVTLLQASLGVTIASGRPSLVEMLRFPHIYAVVAAVFANVAEIRITPVIARPIELLGDMAIPLMLVALGLRLRSVKMAGWSRPLGLTAARLGGGYLAGLAFANAFQLEGEARGCLLLCSVMPAAVVTFVFAEKYGRDSGDVAATVAVSTVVSMVTTPFLLAYGL
jgi:predicted permease